MQEETIQHFYNTEEKLSFIIDYLKLNVKEIADLWGMQSNYISKLREHTHNSLRPMHLYAFTGAYNIPHKVFDKKVKISTEVINILKEAKKEKINNIFEKNKKLMEKLKGKWYAYIYPSNPNSAIKSEGIWIVETYINNDYSVVDEYQNSGILKIGKNQSLIIKESYDERDLTIIRFSNRQIAYKHFRFVIVSTQNGTEHEMINFGFYSRTKYTPTEAKEILGDTSNIQLKLDLDFNDRLVKKVVIK